MRIYDVTRELFSAGVYPGDPVPRREQICRMEQGAPYNLSGFSAGCHSGTHADAPLHFIDGGTPVDRLDPARFLGPCAVVGASGTVSGEQAGEWLRAGPKRILLRGLGRACLSREAAARLAGGGVLLVGTDAMSIAPPEDEEGPHRALLRAGIPILEGLLLDAVRPGAYLLALPLLLAGAEAAPARAVLIDPCGEAPAECFGIERQEKER